jgi:hypothetical protein
VGAPDLAGFRGVVEESANGRGVVSLDLAAAAGGDLDWLGLGWVVEEGDPFRAKVLIRTRRLLSLVTLR